MNPNATLTETNGDEYPACANVVDHQQRATDAHESAIEDGLVRNLNINEKPQPSRNDAEVSAFVNGQWRDFGTVAHASTVPAGVRCWREQEWMQLPDGSWNKVAKVTASTAPTPVPTSDAASVAPATVPLESAPTPPATTVQAAPATPTKSATK